MQHFTTIEDIATLGSNRSAAIDRLIGRALHYKQNPQENTWKNKRLGCIFLNPSMRTRFSTQIAAGNLGMDVMVFNAGKEGWTLEFEDGAIMNGSSSEHIKDAAPILGSYFDILAVRSFPELDNSEQDYAENILKQFIKYSGVPVISLESATLHPLQSLADMITIHENKPAYRPKVVLSWAPHIKPIPQCVANSFAQWAGAWDEVDLVITHPRGLELDEQFTVGAKEINYDQQAALKDADFVYVKNWSVYKGSYGKLYEDDAWMLNENKMKVTNNAKVMHCLPLRRNVEVADDILDGPRSLLTQQGVNRIWSAQSVLSFILEQNRKS